MRLPLPFLLYVTAFGLFGWAGWTIYSSLDLWSQEKQSKMSSDGLKLSQQLMNEGKGSGPAIEDWNYGNGNWWKQLLKINLIGKLPPKQPTREEIEDAKQEAPPPVDMTPLEDIFELVSLVCDEEGDASHVIIRYKPSADVTPPEWWERENAPPDAAGGSTMPRDIARTRNSRRGLGRAATTPGRAPSPAGAAAAPTAMPASSLTGRDIQQMLWVNDKGDERRSPRLWPGYEHIRLVRVAPDAKSAFFERTIPPSGDNTEPQQREEELLKTTMNLSQDVLKELQRLQGRDGDRGEPAATVKKPKNQWQDVESTTRIGNEFHIGRKDEQRFRETPDAFFNNVYVDTYVSKVSSLRGLSVRSVKPEIAAQFGVVTGDVLLEINNRKVESKAQAVNQVKGDYKRGVRTFTTKWLTADGQTVERVYQAPDK